MTILWNDAILNEWYPLEPTVINDSEKALWIPVQNFSQNHPEFDFIWNWEFDTRYIGNHYNLLEKLSTFASNQPRRGLWERNERFYIPKFHGHYHSKFRKIVDQIHGPDTVWGPALVSQVAPTGPAKPFLTAEDDKRYEWGVGEEADLITLDPIFNPMNTSWPGRNDIWGYEGSQTPRRASVGMHSRCSKKLLDAMHIESLKGNHLGSEMGPATVALLHGLKAVFAPTPVFFDREWGTESLQKYFNPGPQGQSGDSADSPFGRERRGSFYGATWYPSATTPMKLYNNWLGREDNGIGGAEVCFSNLCSSGAILLTS